MTFVLDQSPSYKWKVEVNVNKDGTVHTEVFTALFKNITQSRFKEMVKMVEDKQIEDIDVTKEILVGWEDVNEEDGTPISFSKTVLKEFSEDTDFVAAVLAAFRAFYANAQAKN